VYLSHVEHDSPRTAVLAARCASPVAVVLCRMRVGSFAMCAHGDDSVRCRALTSSAFLDRSLSGSGYYQLTFSPRRDAPIGTRELPDGRPVAAAAAASRWRSRSCFLDRVEERTLVRAAAPLGIARVRTRVLVARTLPRWSRNSANKRSAGSVDTSTTTRAGAILHSARDFEEFFFFFIGQRRLHGILRGVVARVVRAEVGPFAMPEGSAISRIVKCGLMQLALKLSESACRSAPLMRRG